MRKLTIGTRGSPLALWQTNWVVDRLRTALPGTEIEVRVIKTKGDKTLDVPLAKIGDKGLFVKELEMALRGEIDIAVHSMKDLPTQMAEGLCIAAVPEREDPSDALISKGPGLRELPRGARIGTSSLRRQAQLRRFRRDLEMCDLRGNLDTRLRKLDEGEFDAIVLAYAGLHRMGWADRVTEKIPTDICLPAVGQGALAVQARDGDDEVLEALKFLDDPETRAEVMAERSLMCAMQGGCQVPIGALAAVNDDELTLAGVVVSLDGRRMVEGDVSGNVTKPEELGRKLAGVLLAHGGDEILAELRRI